MAPQTRSSKPSPGRLTRNSVYGRPPPSLPKPRKSSTNNSPARTTHANDTEVKGKVSEKKGTPWLACRDAYGVMTTVAVSDTGEGVHVRWYYPEDDCEDDEEEDTEENVQMIVSEERGVTPPTAAGPSSAVRRPFPQTPMALHPFDAGSVIRTPIKRAKPLQPSPPRIGDKGVRCLYEKGGVLRELNGGVRVVLRHPVGSALNLSREQVEHLEKEREEEIIRVQVGKLLEEKRRLEEEEACFSDSGYEDGIEADSPSQRDLHREGTNETILVSHSEISDILPAIQEVTEAPFSYFKGPNGELLDHQGCQLLGQEGTVLIDPAYGSPRRIRREEAVLMSTRSVDHSSQDSSSAWHPVRLGPHGTELID